MRWDIWEREKSTGKRKTLRGQGSLFWGLWKKEGVFQSQDTGCEKANSGDVGAHSWAHSPAWVWTRVLGVVPGKVRCTLGLRNGSELAGIREWGWRGEHLGGECSGGKTLKPSVWGNEKKQKASEGPLVATQFNLAFLESSLWQKEVQRKEEARDSLEAAMAT